MGAGGRTMAPGRPASDESKTTGPGCLPVDKPPFTLAKIKWAIPPHCFHRSVLKSSSYLLRDVAAVAVLLCFAMALIPNLPSPLRLAAWPVYWVAQGCALGELWVLAHECGHHTFSGHALLDDAVGFALHTALLVPYFSWKHSHRRHHANSDSLDRDEVFVQRRKAQLSPLAGRVHRSAAGRLATLFFRPRGERHRPVDCARPSLDASRASHSPSVSLIVHQNPFSYLPTANLPNEFFYSPLCRLATLVLQLVLGWPLYLACNAAGRPYPRFASHFDPCSPIFTNTQDQERAQVVLSDAGVLAFVSLFLRRPGRTRTRYSTNGWDWLRGALLNAAFHNITDTHVVHHLFPALPHYHAAARPPRRSGPCSASTTGSTPRRWQRHLGGR
ncbi:hypothetical protein PR202_ga17034 [Eleusine coracana subsp. coracana]|uniref:Uncharacterized protein n=1 Tax=Eleusine coracana subsp. coracana TaxID=191504 RepID=A0AAV5CP83_ELECO|nr:hypothetical protein PR202_ga17034 [Eleusine coracana subsp. coracana]